ncbi:MAG: ABC transporter ATP-binding protein [Deltaproteobacteria bacterium]|nr:ABC transporter ATP-binding protein [Deltaproteobacteria bacterium]MBW1925333.1 ABC transporter ATP-binding protein [Deltaproteobacteria bacterium]MBW2348886.1 ABC transporter ATP-binding protein [Deltaproteobacteria bacterium]
MLLSVEKVNTFYGISHILFDISMQVAEGEVVCLLGRNGVGKTTVLKSIMGLAPARSGSILFMGSEIRGRRPFEIARLGIGFVPEDRIIFPDLTVKENLEMGVNRKIQGPWVLGRVFEAFPILEKRQSQMGGTLSGGEQQMLTIARTLMGNPRLLLLDEPSEGLSPLIVRELGSQIELLKNEGMPILLSEQNSGFTLKLSDRAYILEKGRIQWIGSVSELKEDPGIMKKYLGV